MNMQPDKSALARRIRIVKIILVAVVSAVALYCLYAVIGQMIIWLDQPRFVSVTDGTRTASAGFLIQTAVFLGLFLLTAGAAVFMGIKFFYRRKPASPSDAGLPPTQDRQPTDDTPPATDGGDPADLQ